MVKVIHFRQILETLCCSLSPYTMKTPFKKIVSIPYNKLPITTIFFKLSILIKLNSVEKDELFNKPQNLRRLEQVNETSELLR